MGIGVIIILTFLCNRLHSFKTCLCCFLDIHLCSKKLSTIATNFSLIMSELFPACFSCSNKFHLSQISSGSVDKKIAFETPEAETFKPGDLSKFMRVLSQVIFLP